MTAPTLRQATAIAVDGRALLIEGPPASGKSTLALSLIDRGAQLIGDDGISLSIRDGALIASPPPNTAGVLEIRNVGLIKHACTSAPVSLILTLSQDAPRFVEKAGQLDIAGHSIPHLLFARYNEADPIRAETAMTLHGLPIAAQSLR